MKRLLLALAATLAALPVWAQSEDSVSPDLGLPYWAPGRGVVDHDAVRRRSLEVLDTQFGAFATATQTLVEASVAHCDADGPRDAVVAAFRQTWLTWAPLDSYQFGPIEANAAALTVNFWPDKKNFVGRALTPFLALPAEDQRSPETVAANSAALQGLPALERLLFTDVQACPALIGVSAHLDQTADTLYADWFAPGGWADLARDAGPQNPVYLSAEEFTKTLYTALDFGLIRIADQRLGRPLGTYERSFPKRAEAWRAGLTTDIIRAQLAGIAAMIEHGFAGDIREPDRAWMLRVIEQAEARLDRINAPIPEAVQDPASRFLVEALQTKINQLRDVMAQDIGPNLGVDTGFSPADGD